MFLPRKLTEGPIGESVRWVSGGNNRQCFQDFFLQRRTEKRNSSRNPSIQNVIIHIITCNQLEKSMRWSVFFNWTSIQNLLCILFISTSQFKHSIIICAWSLPYWIAEVWGAGMPAPSVVVAKVRAEITLRIFSCWEYYIFLIDGNVLSHTISSEFLELFLISFIYYFLSFRQVLRSL